MSQRLRLLSPEAVSAIGRLPLLARDVVEGFITGLHTSPFHGFSVEFAEHRKYTPGDPLRDIDWTAYARTDRYFVKRYREETNLRCRIFLDASGSMGFASGQTSKLEYACCLAACIAYLASRQRDATGLTICRDGQATDISPSSRPAHLNALMERLEQARAGGTPPLAQTLHETAERMRRRGLIVVLSDFLDSEEQLMQALKHLRHRKHEVICFHILDPAEESLPYRHVTEFVDMESRDRLLVDPQAIRKDYRKDLAGFRLRYRRLCSDTGMDYVPADTVTPYERLFLQYLARRARM